MITKAIIVVPATLIDYWYNEIQNWLPPNRSTQVERLYGTVPQRHKLINNIKGYKCIVIAGFDTFKRDYELMQQTCKWDVMVVDEGHKAKNVATGLRKALKEFKVEKQKVILTGTPVQNNLEEFFSLLDIVQDNMFENLNQFKTDFANPIKKGLQKNARFSQKKNAI